MEKALEFWAEDESRIVNIINSVKFRFKLSSEFKLEAKSLFFENYHRYYEDDKNRYLALFNRVLTNKAKNYCRNANKFISTIVSGDGELIDIFDILHDPSKSIYDKIHECEFFEYIDKNCDEVEKFICENVFEGWKVKDIAEMLNMESKDIRNNIKQIVSGFIDE